MQPRIVVTGAAWERADAAWPDPAATHDDPDAACAALMRTVDWAAGVARRAWSESGQERADGARAGCTVGTLAGNDYISEYVAGVLATRGPRWLNPEAFGFAAPHSITATVCIELGLGGAAFTIVGPTGGLLAVARGAAALVLGRQDVMLCGVCDWPGAAAGALYRALGIPFTAGRRSASFLVLESGQHAAARGARPLGRVLGWAVRTPAGAAGGESAALDRAMGEAARRAGLCEQWSLLDAGTDRDGPVVGPVLALASALAASAHPAAGPPTMVGAAAPGGPCVALLYQLP